MKKKTRSEAVDLVINALVKATRGMSSLEAVYVMDDVAEYIATSLRGIGRASIAARLSDGNGAGEGFQAS